MDRWVGRVAVVTGASVGIGAAISQQLVEKGLIVAGLARRTDKMEELAKTLDGQAGKFYPIRCDVAREENILRAFKWVSDNLGPVNILINNAGLTRPTTLTNGSTEVWRRVFDVNVLGLCICTREAIKIMKENGIDGHIVHINSIAGHYVPQLPKPVLNVYPASKFAVTALTETLMHELRGEGSRIKVTSVSPGVVDTEFKEGYPDGTKQAIEAAPSLAAADVADAVLYVLSTGPNVQIHDIIIRPVGEAI